MNNDVKFIQGTTLSISDLSKLFENDNFDCVIHLAASKASENQCCIHQSMRTIIL